MAEKAPMDSGLAAATCPPGRRRLLAVALALAVIVAPLAAEAQQAGRVYRIGFLGFTSPGLESRSLAAFQGGLRDLGYGEGNLSIVYRWADWTLSKYPALASDLVQSSVDVIVTPCGPALRAVRDASRTIPVVTRCIDIKDFRQEIDALSRPGGYTTGAVYFSPGVTARRLRLLKHVVPGLSHVGLLSRPESDWAEHWSEIDAAAQALGLRLSRAEWKTPGDLPAVFDWAIAQGTGALLTLSDGTTYFQRHLIFQLAAERSLPVLYDFPMSPSAEVGLMSYSADVGALFRTVAEQVDQILKGKKPGDIPVDRPQKFRLVINREAAQALGLTIPPTLFSHLDRMLE